MDFLNLISLAHIKREEGEPYNFFWTDPREKFKSKGPKICVKDAKSYVRWTKGSTVWSLVEDGRTVCIHEKIVTEHQVQAFFKMLRDAYGFNPFP